MGQAALQMQKMSIDEMTASQRFNHVLKTKGFDLVDKDGVVTLGEFKFTPAYKNLNDHDGTYTKLGKRIIFNAPKYKLMVALVLNKYGNHLITCSEKEGEIHYSYSLTSLDEDRIFGTCRPSYCEQRRFIDIYGDSLI
jgi:hypothetical protein